MRLLHKNADQDPLTLQIASILNESAARACAASKTELDALCAAEKHGLAILSALLQITKETWRGK